MATTKERVRHCLSRPHLPGVPVQHALVWDLDVVAVHRVQNVRRIARSLVVVVPPSGRALVIVQQVRDLMRHGLEHGLAVCLGGRLVLYDDQLVFDHVKAQRIVGFCGFDLAPGQERC